jgi:hypothetical protein
MGAKPIECRHGRPLTICAICAPEADEAYRASVRAMQGTVEAAPIVRLNHPRAIRRTDAAVTQAYYLSKNADDATAYVFCAVVLDHGNGAYGRWYFATLNPTVTLESTLPFLPQVYRDGRRYRLEVVRIVATVQNVLGASPVYEHDAK